MKTISTAFPEQPSALLQWSVEEQQVFLIVRAYSTGVYTAPFHADSTACTSAVSVSREVPELATLQLQVSDAPSDGPEVIESGRPRCCRSRGWTIGLLVEWRNKDLRTLVKGPPLLLQIN